MKQRRIEENREPWSFPHIGQRIGKTTIAVFLCLLIYYLRGYRGSSMPAEACMTAIICMQPYLRDARNYAVNRFAGTLIGVFWGVLFLLFFLTFPALERFMLLIYAAMALGVLVSLYSAVLIRKPSSSSLAAIVFLCIVISFPDVGSPLRMALSRIVGVLLGTAVAILVNLFRLPRTKNREDVFFVRISDLAPDRFTHISSTALFRLNYLFQDGAKISLISEHAPAFFSRQMGEAMLNVPLIVMDGAAVYDADRNEYLWAETIPQEESAPLREKLDELGLSYFIYTIHRNKTCIFHQGRLTEQERVVYDRMKRSPYRDYLDGEIYEPEEIVYFKIIAEASRIAEIAVDLQSFLRGRTLRAVVRTEAGAQDLSALYLYAEKASVPAAEERVMEFLRREDPGLRPVEVFLPTGYRGEHDALRLLHRLGELYEPLRFIPHRKS